MIDNKLDHITGYIILGLCVLVSPILVPLYLLGLLVARFIREKE